jgi:hypothetical protein
LTKGEIEFQNAQNAENAFSVFADAVAEKEDVTTLRFVVGTIIGPI